MSSNDGALIRQWALAGNGIALKSYWDVTTDIEAGRLQTFLDPYIQGFSTRDHKSVGLQMIYPSRRFLPRQVQAFMDFFYDRIDDIDNAIMKRE